MADYNVAQASVLIVPTLGKGANNFQTKLRAELTKVRESVDVKVNADTAAMVAEVTAVKKALEQDPIDLKVKFNGADTIKSELTSIQHKYQDLAGDFKRGLYLNLKVVGLSQLTALGPALASVNTSLVQLSQSALVMPGIMAGLASSFSTALVGSRGLSDAFKAQADASDGAADSARQQRDAQRMVRDATKDLNTTLRDARRNLEDLNAEMRDAPLDEAEAMMDLQEAVAEANMKVGKTAFEMQRDQLRARRAESQLIETRRNNLRLQADVNEANAKGVEGSDAVVAAQERLASAMEDLARGSTVVEKLSDAMGKLSPNAQDFVNRVKTLGGAWGELRDSVQDSLFSNLGADIQGLAGTGLPLLERGLTGIAGAINGNLRTAIASLGDSENQGFLERIFGNTADAQNLFSRAIDPLMSGLLRLSAVGSDSLPRLSDAFGDVMTRFDRFITRADADGSLDKWIDNGLKALTDLGNSLLNVGSILNSVSEAFTGTGGRGLLEMLSDGTKRLADFLKGAEGQQKLKDFFYEARLEFQKWRPTLETIPGILENLADAGRSWADMLLPFLHTAGSLLKNHPGLVTAILYAYLGWRTISPIVSGISTVLETMSKATGMVSGAFGSASGDGANGRASRFSSLMAVGGPIAVGVSAVAALLLNEYVTAQQEAAEKTSYHADMVSRLRGEMDQLSGSLTEQGLLDKLGRAGGFADNNETDGAPKDLLASAQSEFNINREQFGQALTPTNQAARDQLVATTRKAILDELNASGDLSGVIGGDDAKLLQNYNQRAGEQGKPQISNDLLARALTGDQGAVSLFEGAQQQVGFSLSDLLYGYDSPLDWLPGSTNDSTPGLSARAQSGANITKFVMDDTNHALDVGQQHRENSQAVAGRADWKPGVDNPFLGLGSASPYYVPGSGGAAGVRVDTKLADLDPVLRKQIEDKGGRFEELVDGLIIHLDPDRASQYVIPGRANGGFMQGAGTGTSDSILARLSNGEFVMKASSTAMYGRQFMEMINAGAIDPGMLPGFNGGGSPVIKPNQPGIPVGPATSSPFAGARPNPALSGMTPGQVLAQNAPKPAAPKPPSVPSIPSVPSVPVGGGAPAPKIGGVPVAAAPVPTAHGAGGSPGPGNGIPHLTGATPGPGAPLGGPGLAAPAASVASQFTSGLPGLGSLFGGGGSGRSSGPEDFFGDLLKNVGSTLFQVGLDFLSGITGINFSAIVAPFMAVGNEVGGMLGGLGGDPAADPRVQGIIDDHAATSQLAANPFVGTLDGVSAPQGVATPGSSNKQFADSMANQWRNLGFEVGDHAADGYGEHQNGALDITIADAIGAEPTEEQRAKGHQLVQGLLNDPNVYGVIFDNKSWYAGNRGGKDYGGSGPTLGHRDHIHVWYRPGNEGNFGPPAYANGGMLQGPGTGRSDSIMARLSNGEFVTKAASVAKYGSKFMHALNDGQIDPSALPGFAGGTHVQIPNVPPPAPPVPAPLPPPTGANVQGAGPQGPQAEQTDTAQAAVGDAMSGIGSVLSGTGAGGGGGIPGGGPAAGEAENADPRGILGAAPTNQDHNAPWLSKGISGAASTIGSAIGTAIGVASAGATGGMGGAAGGAAAGLAQGAAQVGGQVVNGAVNILSSLLVGTASGGTTPNAYGAPVLPQGPPQSAGASPRVVNNYGDIHTANYDEFYKGQQRREQQQNAPVLPQR